jgi:hypothetical protein
MLMLIIHIFGQKFVMQPDLGTGYEYKCYPGREPI